MQLFRVSTVGKTIVGRVLIMEYAGTSPEFNNWYRVLEPGEKGLFCGSRNR